MSFSSFLQFHANIKKFWRLAPFTTPYCALLCEELDFHWWWHGKTGQISAYFYIRRGGDFWQKDLPLEITYMLSHCHSLQFCNILSENK